MQTQELLDRINPLKNRVKKAFAQCNKYANLSTKGKCTEEEWHKAVDELEAALEEVFSFSIDVRALELGILQAELNKDISNYEANQRSKENN